MCDVSRKSWAGLAFAVGALSAAGMGMPESAAGQTSGSTAAAMAGGALGLTSGATLAFTGSLVPCTQSRPGPACVRWSAVAGGSLGLTGGAMLGAADSDRLGDAAIGAGVGFAVGTMGGMLLKSAAERFGWADVATIGLLGGAIGAAPLGSAIGVAGGAVVGLAAWGLGDSFDLPDFVSVTAAGLALGGLAEWLARGVGAQSESGEGLRMILPVAVRW